MEAIASVSLSGGQGKTTTIFLLGLHLAALGRRVLWVDADPQANLTFYSGAAAGLSLHDVLRGKCSALDAVQSLSWENLFLIPAGRDLFQVGDYLASTGNGGVVLRRRLRDITQYFDYCLLDSPPARSQIVMTAVGAATKILIPVELTVKGSNCLVETLEMLKGMAETELWLGDVLGVVPFRDRWIGVNQSKDARENGEFIRQFGLKVFPGILESEKYKQAIREGKTLTQLGHPHLDQPFLTIVEVINHV